jgi:hypothetical protein
MDRMGLTFSSIATLRDFHTNSQTAITQAIPMPPINTTNTPPTFANPNSFAAELDLEASSWNYLVIYRLIAKSGLTETYPARTPTPLFLPPTSL